MHEYKRQRGVCKEGGDGRVGKGCSTRGPMSRFWYTVIRSAADAWRHGQFRVEATRRLPRLLTTTAAMVSVTLLSRSRIVNVRLRSFAKWDTLTDCLPLELCCLSKFSFGNNLWILPVLGSDMIGSVEDCPTIDEHVDDARCFEEDAAWRS